MERNVHNCALVCRSWHRPACRVLYEKMNIPRSSRKLLRCLSDQENNLGHSCKVLEFWSGSDDEIVLDTVEFAQLLSFLPNVKRIELTEYSHTLHYLKLLKTNAHLLLNAQAIIFDYCVKNLKISQFYIECLLSFKNSMQQMRITSLDTTIHTTDGRSGNIISFLSDFKSLLDLQIENIDYNRTPSFPPVASGIPLLHMFTVMRSCSRLQRFALRNTFREPENDNEEPFDHRELKYLKLDILDISEKHINYIISNITKLKQFKLKSGYPNIFDDLRTPEDWMGKIGSESLSSFFNHLANIDRVTLSLGEMFAINIAELWPLVRRVFSDRVRLPAHLTIVVGDTKIFTSEKIFTLKKLEEGIFLRYGLEINEVLPIDNTTVPTTHAIMPFDYSEMNIQTIELHIRLDAQETLRARSLEFLPSLDLIDSILNTLPDLHYLHVKIGPVLKKALQVKVGSGELEFDETAQNIVMPRKETPKPSPNSNERFKHVLLQRVESAEVLRTILKRLPNTMYLKIFDYHLKKDKNFNLTMDFGNLHLQYFMFNIGRLLDCKNDKQVIVLQIEEKQSNESVLYRLQRETQSQAVKFQRIRAGFFKSNREFKSRSTTFLIIQCFKIEKIKICLSDHIYFTATIDVGGRDIEKSE
ncbi:unnamed protein product [Mucor hiemalis]